MMKVPYFVPWITNQDKKSVIKALSQRWLTNGPYLKKFEEKFSSFIGSRYSAGVSSATHALHLSLKSLGIGPGDEVIVPTMTFSATADAVSFCGAEPILADVDSDTFNISVREIKRKITKKTKSVIVVHYGGQSCDMEEILSISKDSELSVVEDCAHSLGSTYKNTKCGNIGTISCFSFYPTKVITTGEGGMVSTNHKDLFNEVKLLRSHGMSILPIDRESTATWEYDIVKMGFNYRLDEIRASLGLSQLYRIKKINDMRIKIAKKYNQEIEKIDGLTIPYVKSDRDHIYHLYTIKVEKEYPLTRDELFQKLYKKGIFTSVQYSPLHLMSYNKKKYQKLEKDFPIANKLRDQILSLPIFPTMSSKQVELVVSSLK